MAFVAVAIGAFYVFAGVVALRVITLGNLMDGLLEALDGSKVDAKERLKTRLLTIGSYLTAASGAALLTLSSTALLFFTANGLVQGGYLAWAAKALVPEDDADRRGRQQTINAFVLYLAATAFVAWLLYRNELRPWPADPVAQATEFAAPVLAALLSWASLHVPLKRPFGAGGQQEFPGHEADPAAPPRNLRLRPEWQSHPLWNADIGDNISPWELDLPEELLNRIERWDDLFQDTYNGDDPASSGFKSAEDERLYREEGKAIAIELTKVWPGKVEVDEQFR